MHQQAILGGRPGRPFNDQQLDRLLRLLADEESFVFLESARVTPENHRSLLFLRPSKLLIMQPCESVADFFAAIEQELSQGHHLAGWFAYELGYLLESRLRPLLPEGDRPLAVLGVFPPPLIYNHTLGRCLKIIPWEPRDNQPLSSSLSTCSPLTKPELAANKPRLNLEESQYLQQVEQIKNHIAAGDTYQVNYTIKQEFPYQGSAAALYRTLRRNQRVSYAAWLKLNGENTLSFSPELFLRRKDRHCTVRPMKGTCRRGLTAEEDVKMATFLRNDEKNRSENVMIVDLLRNDLGRICRPGTVKTTQLFTTESYETLHQMTSTIQGELYNNLNLAEIFQALFPCGSVTGAPKIRTMEIIRELEKEPRGVYTGAIGFISPQNEMVFNVPIRTVCLRDGLATMGIGSGIVNDSDPQREWQECQLKGQFLSQPIPSFVLIETMLWQPEYGYHFLDLHLERLLTSATRLSFVADLAEIQELLVAEATTFTEARRVRLSLAKDGTLDLTHAIFSDQPCFFSWEELPTAEGRELPVVTIATQPVDPDQPLLYHKTNSRAIREFYDGQRQKALAAGYHDVLFINTRGEVSEGAISNIFIRKGGQLLTPPLSSGLLNGVLRRHLLSLKHPPLREKTIYIQDLREAEAIYIGNSLRGLSQVRLRSGGDESGRLSHSSALPCPPES